ncbi:hypothetical protein H5J25_12775 [Sphingomonas aliaeris]|uniref:Uncharacterized protein n=1 Tax=Sphingomonas aliaeris TaxID=2759526 RepID=A0A974NSW7_9SPHN|nr:hypothetical protein [Sphingomonas aliaeris]QQV76354.1 hypothetical protein H5J25_12775 [Sphingomonas aliaeris]
MVILAKAPFSIITAPAHLPWWRTMSIEAGWIGERFTVFGRNVLTDFGWPSMQTNLQPLRPDYRPFPS